MSRQRFIRDGATGSVDGNGFTELSVPSWPFVGYFEGQGGGSFGSTTTSAEKVADQCFSLQDSGGAGISKETPYPYEWRYCVNREAKSRMSFHKDVDCLHSDYVVDSPVRFRNKRCEYSLESDNIQIPNFSDLSDFQKDELSLLSSTIGNNELEMWKDPLIHAYLCRSDYCTANCKQIRRLLFHARSCRRRDGGQVCECCGWIGFLFEMHVQICQLQNCPLPFCEKFQEGYQQQQQQEHWIQHFGTW